MRAGGNRWVEALERVTRVDATYQDAPALLNRARRELRQAAVQADEQARRQAQEQAQRKAEEQTNGRLKKARRQEKRQEQPPPQQRPPSRPADGTQARPAQGKPSAAGATLVLLLGIFGFFTGSPRSLRLSSETECFGKLMRWSASIRD